MGSKEISTPAMIGIVAAVLVVVVLIGMKVMAPKRAAPEKASATQGEPVAYQQYKYKVQSGGLSNSGGAGGSSNDMESRMRASRGGGR